LDCQVRRLLRFICISLVSAAAVAVMLHAQARSAPDWTTEGFDAQRTSWMRVDPYISLENLRRFQFLWKLKLDNESRHGNSLTAPVALGNLMTFRGFKSLIFVGGSSNNVYAIDYDFGTLFWRTHHNYTAGPREYAGSAVCPGGMTLPVARATELSPATQLSFFGFARPPRPAEGNVGEPGRGAPQLAEIAARQAARGSAARANEPAARGASPPSRAPNFVFSVAADGLARALIPDTGDLGAAPARLLPANATATGLMWTRGRLYAAATNTCGGASPGVVAMDYRTDKRTVTTWDSEGAPIAGLSLGADGTIFVATRNGNSRFASSVVALDGESLAVKDWFTTGGDAFISMPVVFSEDSRTYVAASTDASIYLLDTASLGGANHRTPGAVTPASANARFAEGLATWRDGSGTRWILTAVSGTVSGYRLSNAAGAPRLEPAWRSRDLVSPRTPIIVNGVVFALSGGREPGVNAALYALHPATGREVWSSGNTITSVASAGLSAGTGQVYVVTADNTVWAFGIPLAIN
jgi:outer membrane protein assembly factor BamB